MRRVIATPAGPVVLYDRHDEAPCVVPGLHRREAECFMKGRHWADNIRQALHAVLQVNAVFPGATVVDSIDLVAWRKYMDAKVASWPRFHGVDHPDDDA